MSKFVTRIPIDIHAVLELLPKRATPLDVLFNPNTATVEVHWDDDDLETGYTFPIEFPAPALEQGRVPPGVRVRAGADIRPHQGRRFGLGRAERVLEGDQPTTRVEVTLTDVPTEAQAPVEAKSRKGVKGRL